MGTHTGKLASHLDPRMPGNAPEQAPDSTHKPMPEFPLDDQELKYPPDDQLTGQPKVPPGTRPEDAELARSEVPRKAPPLIPAAVAAALEATAACASACERTAKAMAGRTSHGHHARVALLCSDICRLLRDHLGTAGDAEMAVFIRDVSATCARTCEACAVLCEQHASDPVMAESAAACRRCAAACRELTA
ncbi:MAG: hypothetical protein QM724_12285 [Flavobacteriales bacterium]